jgi:flagellar biosynthesis protein FlhA
MPGKQMAIDADLNAGLITEEEAARRRLEIRREADFYGSMDGACRYVQGDVIATFIIAVICIIGGSLMGIIVRGEPIIDALKMYTTYTIGGALSVQIPALLISIATGLLVSRAAVEHDLGRDIVRQLGTQPWAVFFGAAVLCILTLFTPLPKWLLLSVAAFLFFLGYLTSQRTRLHLQEERKKKEEEEKEKLRRPESILPLLHVDPIELEIGYNLIPLAQPERGGDLLERVTLLRRQIALDLGIIVPQIRIRDNIQLEKNTYVIKLRGTEMARNRVYSDKYLALVTPKVNKDVEIKGEVTTEPIFGVQALWVEEGERQKAEKAGYTLFDPSSVIATHLTETIKRNAPIVLGRQETQSLLDNLRQKAPTVVSELVPQLLTLGEFQKVLHNLLRENISIRDLLTICETLADWAPRTRNTEFLTEKVRSSLAHQISRQFATDNNTIEVITLDPTLEDKLVSSIKEREGEEVLVLAPEEQIKFISLIQQTLVQVRKPVPLLTSPRLRRLIRHLTQMTIPDLAVISYAEVVPQLKVVSLGRVKEK